MRALCATVALAAVACGPFYSVPELDAATDAPIVNGACGRASNLPRLVQEVTGHFPGTSLTVPLCQAAGSGDLLVMVGAANTSPLSGVSGGGVASWATAALEDVNSNVEIWYGTTTGGETGVTLTTTAESPIWASVTELSRAATLPFVMQASMAQDAATTRPDAGAFTTTTSPELVIVGVAAMTNIPIAAPTDAGWLALPQVSEGMYSQGEWYRVESAGVTLDAQFPGTESRWDAAMVGLALQ